MGFAKRRNFGSPLRHIVSGLGFRRLLIAAWIKRAGDQPAQNPIGGDDQSALILKDSSFEESH